MGVRATSPEDFWPVNARGIGPEGVGLRNNEFQSHVATDIGLRLHCTRGEVSDDTARFVDGFCSEIGVLNAREVTFG